MRIEAESLACVRGDRLIFRDVSFALAPGGALVLTGPNGSGKTSLLRVLAGLLTATIGRVRFFGAGDAPLAPEAHDQALHFVAHDGTTKSALTVSETLRFHADILGASRAKLAPALETWGLSPLADISGGLLSAGQKRRVALARLSLQDRPVWLLDEPLIALDRAARDILQDACTAHRSRGGVVVAASHEPFLHDAAVLEMGAAA